ncbi:PIDD1 isoform 9 [Pan troglodytes]|uniref:p53-induced death domain-containing protein 1 n=1 Tax=Pan troglodytes TaxID=9598 RepID=A0A2J8JVM4_PANTR|nr:PIDD1 isoform 9 [Pan troglodytes]
MAATVEGPELEAAAAAGDASGDSDAGSRALPFLGGNRLSLDLYPGGCQQLLHLCVQQPLQLLQVEFLRLSTHEDPQLLEATLAQLPQSLSCLRSLVLKGGQRRDTLGACLRGALTNLPAGLSGLAHLAHLDLSFNSLETLPACVLQMRGLGALLLSHNCLSELPEALGALPALTFLTVTHNRLQTLPPALGALSTLQRLDLSQNLLDTLPPEIGGLGSLLELNLASNRLQSLPASLVAALIPEMPRLFLTSDLDSFPVTPRGCSVTLACGIRLQFPAGATATPITIRYRLLLPEPGLVPLGPHDALLSHVLELQPHGVAFQQDVGLWLLFTPPRARRCREVVVRTRNDNSWGDLETYLEEEAPQRLWAHCQVPHFSWFLVVSRPVSNACLVPPEGTLLCSSGHPGVKVIFPPGATEEPRRVSMQVVRMAGRELQALLGEPEAAVSPLLCLSQSGPPSFLRPVTVQLPLPSGITGLSLDRSRLHLLYWAPPAATWDDITAQVVLELTHLYARFQVTHFSWYWLWYTTKNCVGGLARKAWERLRLHRVNLIALQRRRDPEQVLLQCLPRNKVDATLRRLLERYRGPEPSDTVEMFEGEEFFAAFERGIDVDADRPDCVEGRICFVFYSHLKNVKEVYVTTTLDREAQAVRGQRLRGSEGPRRGAGLSLAPLNLGDAETGFLTQSNLLSVAGRLGLDWPAVALHLGVSYREVQRIRHEFRDDLDEQIRHMLFSWAERQAGQPGAVGLLVQALEQSDRQDVAEEVRAVLELGRRKYQDGIRRTGLAPKDAALPGSSAPQPPEPAQA